MKETVNVNIGSQAFTLDEDAYRVLRNYLEDIRSRLPEYDTETMGDIEARIAEIFREIVSSPMRVITLDTVRQTMNRMGSPADFGERRGSAPQEEQPEPEPRKLFRSRTDRSIAGICGGLAEFFHADTTVLRLITLFLIDTFRRTLDLGLHHSLDRHSGRTRTQIQHSQQKPIKP